MSRYAILIGREHGSEQLAVVGEIGASGELNAAFKRIYGAPGNLAELHLIVSDQGLVKRKKFGPDEATEVAADDLLLLGKDGEAGPTFKQGMEMLAEIEKLTTARVKDREIADEAISALKAEIERLSKGNSELVAKIEFDPKEMLAELESVKNVAAENEILRAEIERLKAASTQNSIAIAAQGTANGSASAGEKSPAEVVHEAESGAGGEDDDSAGPELDGAGDSLAEADEDGPKPGGNKGGGAKRKG